VLLEINVSVINHGQVAAAKYGLSPLICQSGQQKPVPPTFQLL